MGRRKKQKSSPVALGEAVDEPSTDEERRARLVMEAGVVEEVDDATREGSCSVTKDSESPIVGPAEMKRDLAERRLRQLQRSKERRLREFELRLEHELEEAAEEAELSRLEAGIRKASDSGDERKSVSVQLTSALDSRQPEVLDMLGKMARGMEELSLRMSLPQVSVKKFDGNPAEYRRFYLRFDELVGKQRLSEAQKMTRLLQFVEGRALKSIAGLEGSPNAYTEAMKILWQRFGQAHQVVTSCINALTEGANISRNDPQGLQDFADSLRATYVTLSGIGGLDEMTTGDLVRIVTRLPIAEQGKWRDEAQKMRRRGMKPDFEALVEFVERRAEALNDPVFGQAILPQYFSKPAKQRAPQTARANVMATSASPAGESICEHCKRDRHPVHLCPVFKAKPLKQRKLIAVRRRLCFNCLGSGHSAMNCASAARCQECGQKHHSLLHFQRADGGTAAAEVPPANEDAGRSAVSRAMVSAACGAEEETQHPSSRIGLEIVPVTIITEGKEIITTRALLDSGSEASFASSSLVRRIGTQPSIGSPVSIITLSGEGVINEGEVNLCVCPVDDDELHVDVKNVKVVPHLNIRQVQVEQEELSRWPHLTGLQLPDIPPGEVELILGADVPEAHLQEESRVGAAGQPYAVRTIFGWSVMGPITQPGRGQERQVNVNFARYGDELLSNQMQQFLDIDGIGKVAGRVKELSVEDRRLLDRMKESTKLIESQYEVPMLWKAEKPWLPNNRKMAEARLKGLRRKLEKDESLRKGYAAVIETHVEKGYARRLSDEEAASHSNVTWYLPHHAVRHPAKPGKVRVVFDAAAKYEGVSLNDQLAHGPDLTNSLVGVLLRFRQERVAISADIEGMFLQVRVSDRDADALRFLWWPGGNLDCSPVPYQMSRHVFGAADSPSCAAFALRKTADDNKEKFPAETTEAVKRDFYVDDFLKSVPTAKEAVELAGSLAALCLKGGFRLTKWVSNDRLVLASIAKKERARPDVDLDLDELPVERTLGIRWMVEGDQLGFKVGSLDRPDTKRGVLAAISSLYDPLGFVSPVMLKAKLIMQALWKLKSQWDEPLPDEELKLWINWKKEVKALEAVRLNRCYRPTSAIVETISLHLFSDASESGYGSCAYLRFVCSDGSVHTTLVQGKSRVAPAKPLTIPRMELQAAVLSVRLYASIRNELTYPLTQAVFWTDSKTVLQFICNEKARFHTFVAHRVTEIREATDPAQWRHCPGTRNPADDASRGLTPIKLVRQQRWWHGPSFLSEHEERWPALEIEQLPRSHPEVKEPPVVVHQTSLKTTSLLALINRCGVWLKLCRLFVWLARFVKWLAEKRRPMMFHKSLSSTEINRAEITIVRLVQQQSFPSDGHLPPALEGLAPFRSDDGVLRVGGRLRWAAMLSFEEKHPMILPKGHHVSMMIVRHYHTLTLHGDGRASVGCRPSLAERALDPWPHYQSFSWTGWSCPLR